MELILENKLPHQQKAVDAVCNVLTDVRITKPDYYFLNPAIDIRSPQILSNLKNLQAVIHPEIRGSNEIIDYLNIDVKMETGTGKTYVYIKTIFELHKRYNLNKFIIAVPSLAIKAGTRQFIEDSYVRRHFADECGYNSEIDLGVVETVTKKKGKFHFPTVIREFVKGSFQDEKKIYVLLINMQLFTGGTMLTRNDYDYFVENYDRPFDAMRATRPIVIIDEPHRFTKDNKAFSKITEELKPQMIIRYGATFPEKPISKGKVKTTVKDYHNVVYNLDACNSFQNNLIKGIAKEHFQSISGKDDKVKIANIESKSSATFHYISKGTSIKSAVLKSGDSLSLVCDALEGITITGIDRSKVYLSNGQEYSKGAQFSTDMYTSSYQEQMIKLAIDRHFEIEKENFCNRKYKIKTLALFFIDDISSYRASNDGKAPYLKLIFERLLLEKINEELNKLSEINNDYKEYLQTSKLDISACHAGYFSQDNDDSDEKIAKEVDDILRNKKSLLSIKNKDGSYNTRRFLFSKWTLKEGWDNPNVFTITKLRSSGSENSKLQEVGRGLRLPVDENGNRISNEEFTLNYIVDFTEADFAEKLVEQINGEIPQAANIKDNFDEISVKIGKNPDDLFIELLTQKYIDRNFNIKTENRDAFFENYPEFTRGIPSNKIKDLNKDQTKKIKIRPEVYNKLKDLWLTINQKYLLLYDEDINSNIHEAVNDIFAENIFSDVYLSSKREFLYAENGSMDIIEDGGVTYKIEKPLLYNEFLKYISNVTKIPISTLHNGVVSYYKKFGTIDEKHINEYSAKRFIKKFTDWKNSNLQGRFRYEKVNSRLLQTALTDKSGAVINEIPQGRIGTKFIKGTPSAKYLYDSIAFDSPLEKDNILSGESIDEIIVYGKIPRRSIAIPTITGGTYSPDFMYVVKKPNGEKELNIIVETKDVENKSDLREAESIKIQCAKEFFNQLKIEGYTVSFRTQLNNKKMKQIIDET